MSGSSANATAERHGDEERELVAQSAEARPDLGGRVYGGGGRADITEKKEGAPPGAPWESTLARSETVLRDDGDVLGLRALVALLDLELDLPRLRSAS